MNAQHMHIDLIDAPDFSMETSSGRATWDERGNSIWEWQTAPGVFSRDISSQQLQALEANNLQLLDHSQPGVDTLWTRNRNGKPSTKAMQANELVMPMRARPNKSSGFDSFLKRIGLPA